MDETIDALPDDAMPDTPANESTPPGSPPPGGEAPGEVVPISAPAPAGPALPDDFPALPPQYSTAGNAGFFNRQNESVPTAVTVGPDGALYVSELSALPYPEGHARVLRVEKGEGGVSFDGETPAGVSQIHASGFEQINGLTFDDEGNLYVLEYVAGQAVYDPTLDPAELPPSRIIKVGTDGVREQISGEELLLGNYVLAHEGKLYATINDADTENGKLLAYERDAESGEWTHEVVADGLLNPRGLDVGPDGKLYILEAGVGTPADDPDAENAPVIPFIPGLVSQSGGYTGAISAFDTETGEVERVYEGLPSFREFNPATGEDRVISIGPNGFGINDAGEVYIASGGGLSNQSVAALGPFAEGVSGILKLDGLFDEDPSNASWELVFDSVEYAGAFGPDGATTLFNTQSNLNDVEIGPDGKVYTVDAARNVLYELDAEGDDVESVTVLQKTPPVLTPVQYALVLAAGGDPSADYRVEINEITFKGANELPDTPGRVQALAAAGAEGGTPPGAPAGPPPGGPDGEGLVPGLPDAPDAGAGAPPPRGEDAAIGGALGDGDDALEPGEAIVPPNGSQPVEGTDPSVPVDNPGAPPVEVVEPTTGAEPPFEVPGKIPGVGAPDGPPTDAGEFDPNNPPPNVGPPTPLIPGPVDPTAPPVLADNPYSIYFDPFFGTYAPAPGQEPALSDGDGGSYEVDQLFVFGDRLTEDGGYYGKAAVAARAGAELPIDEAPYSPYGNFTDGLNWTTYLSRILGVDEGVSVFDPDGDLGGADTNFSYLDATARELVNPFDPLQATSGGLTNFAGQIDAFERVYGGFSEDDLVVVSFGGNDLTLPPSEGQTPMEAAAASLQATIEGIARLVSLGAENLLVPNLVDVEIVPIFSDPAFQEALGVPPGALSEAVTAYNAALEGALNAFGEAAGVGITLLDTNRLFEAIVAEPGSYGFSNVDEPVLVTPPNVGVEEPIYNPAIVGRDPAVQHATLFLDVLFSPTALGHSIIAETARDALLGRGADPATPGLVATIEGTEGDDNLFGTDGDDVLDAGGGRYDRMTGGEGADTFLFGAEASNGAKDRDVVWDFEAGVDKVSLVEGAAVERAWESDRGVVLRLEGDGDKVHLRGEGVTLDGLDLPGLQDDALLV